MQRDEIIDYLNRIRPYINLKSICEEYNRNTQNFVDYNNLRVVLNGKSKTRLSDFKLIEFLNFVYKHLYARVFDVYNFEIFMKKERFEQIIQEQCKQLSGVILGEIKSEISNK